MAKKEETFDDLYESDDDLTVDVDGGDAPDMDLGDQDLDEDDAGSTVSPEGDDTDQQSEADIQREKSWEGRLRARELKLTQGEADLAAKQSAAPEDGDTGDDDDQEGEEADTSKMSPEELEAFEKEYPDVQQYMDTRIKQTEKKVDDAVAPLVKNSEDDALKVHFQTLEGAHADFQDVAGSEDMQFFIDEAPAYARDGMRRVLAEGTALECIELLDDYKEARKIAPKPTDNNGARKRGGKNERRQEVAVRSGGRVHVPPARMKGEEDFDSLYENLSDDDLDD